MRPVASALEAIAHAFFDGRGLEPLQEPGGAILEAATQSLMLSRWEFAGQRVVPSTRAVGRTAPAQPLSLQQLSVLADSTGVTMYSSGSCSSLIRGRTAEGVIEHIRHKMQLWFQGQLFDVETGEQEAFDEPQVAAKINFSYFDDTGDTEKQVKLFGLCYEILMRHLTDGSLAQSGKFATGKLFEYTFQLVCDCVRVLEYLHQKEASGAVLRFKLHLLTRIRANYFRTEDEGATDMMGACQLKLAEFNSVNLMSLPAKYCLADSKEKSRAATATTATTRETTRLL